MPAWRRWRHNQPDADDVTGLDISSIKLKQLRSLIPSSKSGFSVRLHPKIISLRISNKNLIPSWSNSHWIILQTMVPPYHEKLQAHTSQWLSTNELAYINNVFVAMLCLHVLRLQRNKGGEGHVAQWTIGLTSQLAAPGLIHAVLQKYFYLILSRFRDSTA